MSDVWEGEIKMKFLLFSLLSLFVLAEEVDVQTIPYTQYTLKKGDTISEVLYSRGIYPLYGDNKKVQATLKLNRLTLEEAKKLDVGDIILLPKFMDRPVSERIVYKTIDISKAYPKKALAGEFYLTYSGRSERINYGSAKVSGDLYNNFGFKLQSDLNRFIHLYDVQLSGFLGAGIEKNNDPIEQSSDGGRVDTTTNFNIFGGVYIESLNIEAKPFLMWQYEQFDGFDLNNNDIVRRRNKISWFGLGLKHTFYLWEQPLIVKPSISYTVVSASEKANDDNINGLTGFKTNFEATFTLDHKWKIGTDISFYSFSQFKDYNMLRYALLFGRNI